MVNQSIVDLEDISSGDGRLFCLTNTAACCRNADTESGGIGTWYFPDASELPGMAGHASGFDRDRGASFVALEFNGTSSSVSTSGLFRCEIPDVNGRNVTLLAGIYRDGEGMVIMCVS